MRSRRRSIWFVMLLLAGGSIINVAVAWGIQLWSNDVVAGSSHTYNLDDEWGWTTSYSFGYGSESVAGRQGSIQSLFPNYTPSDVDWGMLADHEPEPGVDVDLYYFQECAGWPLKSMWGGVIVDTTQQIPTVSVWAIDVPPDPESDGLLLALRPMMPQFILGSVFWALVLTWPLAFFRSVARQRRRFRLGRGLCPSCRYTLQGATRCPECGDLAQINRD